MFRVSRLYQPLNMLPTYGVPIYAFTALLRESNYAEEQSVWDCCAAWAGDMNKKSSHKLVQPRN